MRGEEDLAPEAAAVAAFLSDISGFLDDEEDHSRSSSNVHQHTQLTACVQNETLANNVTAPTVRQAQRPLPEDEAARKRALHNIQTGKRRDAYCQRLKDAEVELAARLEEMQQNRKNDSGRSAWRAIAMRQLEGRRVAEAQQERLQAAAAGTTPSCCEETAGVGSGRGGLTMEAAARGRRDLQHRDREGVPWSYR